MDKLEGTKTYIVVAMIAVAKLLASLSGEEFSGEEELTSSVDTLWVYGTLVLMVVMRWVTKGKAVGRR